MTRVKRSVHARKKRRATLEMAKGYRGDASRHYKTAKEAVLKAHRIGLTVDTRSLSCRLESEREGAWGRFSATWDPARALPLGVDARPSRLTGFWQVRGDFALTIAQLSVGGSTPSVLWAG